MAYYHCLGGYNNNVNDIDKYNLPFSDEFIENVIEPMSLYRLYKIFKSGYILCKDRIPNCHENYNSLKYDTSTIYLSKVKNCLGKYTSSFAFFAGASISLKINEKIKDDFELLGPYIFEDGMFEEGENRVKDSISLSYVEAICIPVYTLNIYEQMLYFASKNPFSLIFSSYLKNRENEFEIVKKLIKKYNLNIPVIETFTDEEVDISSIIDELKDLESKELLNRVLERHNNLLTKT